MLPNKKCILLFATCILFNLNASGADPSTRRILPTSLTIRVGEDMQLRLKKVFDSEEDSCYLRAPTLRSYNLKSLSGESISEDDSSRIVHWSENGECGALVRNITKEDSGRWRLTAKSQNRTIVDAVTVDVLDKFNNETVTEVSILSGLAYSLVLSENTSYCMVQHPHGEHHLDVADECKIEMARPTLAEDGKWIARTGISGQIEEVARTTRVNVLRENLIYGYRQPTDGNSLHLYCNVLHYDQGLQLCRFDKVDGSENALSLSEGLRKGRYGYYGGGLAAGECGLTIELSNESDTGLWHCLVGFPNQSPFGAYIHVLSSRIVRDSSVHATISSVSPVMTIVSASLSLDCRASVPLSYCRFKAPDGTLFSPLPEIEVDEERAGSSNYRYVGSGLSNGRCGMLLSVAEHQHNGTWTCHMGPKQPGLELTSTIDVRIAETPLAATSKFARVERIGNSVTLQCRTVPNRVALQYCRFYSPENIGIHVNHEITRERPLILENGDMYWFSGNATIGDCGITIAEISLRHFGNWTCAAILEAQETSLEAYDTILVYIENNENLSVTAGMGIAMGSMAILIVVAASIAFFVKSRRRTQNNSTASPGCNTSERISMHSLSSDSSTVDTLSNFSVSSENADSAHLPTNRIS